MRAAEVRSGAESQAGRLISDAHYCRAMASEGADVDISDSVSDSLRNTLPGQFLGRGARWFLFDGNRWVVVLLLAGAIFAATVAVGTFGPVSVQRFLSRGVSPASALVEILKSIVAIVTIVLSINQLVISPQLGPVSDQREAFEDTMSLREEVERRLDLDVAPLSPAAFSRSLLVAVDEQARELREQARGEQRDEIARFVDDLRAETETTVDRLDGTEFRKFEVVPATMNMDVSGRVQEARRLADEASESERRALLETVRRLKLFATARAYLKTAYIRSEYVSFSQALLLIGLPSLLAAFYATQIYDPGVFPGRTLGVENRLWFVSGALTVSLVPFAVLISYVSRLATLSQSTVFVGPFVAGGRDETPGGGD